MRVNALVEFGRRLESPQLHEPLAHRAHHLGDAACTLRHGKLNGLLPDLFQVLDVARVRRRHLEVGVNGLGVVAAVLLELALGHEVLVATRVGCRQSSRLLLLQLIHHRRPDPGRVLVRLGHPQRVLPHPRILVHLDCLFELPELDPHILGRAPVPLVHQSPRLRRPDLCARGRVVVVGNAQRARPVLLVHVHVDGLLGLLGVDELDLSLLEIALVLEVHGFFEVDLWQLGLERRPRELKGLVELAGLGGVVNRLLDEPKLGQQLGAGLPAEVHGPSIGHLL